MRRRCASRLILVFGALALVATVAATASAALVIGGFSSLPVGQRFGDDWQLTELPSVEPARFRVEDDGGTRVVRVDATAAAASLTRTVDWDLAAHPTLAWRWRVDRVVAAGDLATRSGDDFAARLYVMFDFPLDRLSLFDRTKLRIARWVYGEQVPAAALCYVWANREAVGTEAWSAYTDRVRIIVLRNADDAVGDWAAQRRDVVADYRRAFGDVAAVPIGVAIAADTDQTGETVTAWFGDIVAGVADD